MSGVMLDRLSFGQLNIGQALAECISAFFEKIRAIFSRCFASPAIEEPREMDPRELEILNFDTPQDEVVRSLNALKLTEVYSGTHSCIVKQFYHKKPQQLWVLSEYELRKSGQRIALSSPCRVKKADEGNCYLAWRDTGCDEQVVYQIPITAESANQLRQSFTNVTLDQF